MKESELRVLDRATVKRCVASFNPLEVVEQVLRRHARGRTGLPAEAYLDWTNRAEAECWSAAMPGALLGGGVPVYGMKIINGAASNPAAGLDRTGGIALLFDAETSRPSLMADGGYLSVLQAAAYTLVSLRHLGPEEYQSVSIIGCGTLARAHLRLAAQYQPEISTVYVYDTGPGRAEALVAWAARRVPRLAVLSCDTARQAVAASTVLITLTTSRRPYIKLGWFQPASFVSHVSLDDVTEEVFLGAEAVFVDDASLVFDNTHRVLGRLMAEGKLCELPPADRASDGCRRMAGTLGDVLIKRREGIRPRHGVVISNPFGMSVLDLGLLERVAEAASAAGLGQSLPVFGASRDGG